MPFRGETGGIGIGPESGNRREMPAARHADHEVPRAATRADAALIAHDPGPGAVIDELAVPTPTR